MHEYTVIDLETTGLRPSRRHRVVEIGAVQLNHQFEPVSRWETLVNPDRRIGASRVHGITQTMLDGAPTFDDVAGDVIEILDGRTLVAHNAAFEIRFLESELRRCGVIGFGLPICTSMLASECGLPRSLSASCELLGIARSRHHRALDDAITTAALLKRLATQCDLTSRPWALTRGHRVPTGRVWTREDARAALP